MVNPYIGKPFIFLQDEIRKEGGKYSLIFLFFLMNRPDSLVDYVIQEIKRRNLRTTTTIKNMIKEYDNKSLQLSSWVQKCSHIWQNMSKASYVQKHGEIPERNARNIANNVSEIIKCYDLKHDGYLCSSYFKEIADDINTALHLHENVKNNSIDITLCKNECKYISKPYKYFTPANLIFGKHNIYRVNLWNLNIHGLELCRLIYNNSEEFKAIKNQDVFWIQGVFS